MKSVCVFVTLSLILRTAEAMSGPFLVDTLGKSCTAPAAWSGTVSVPHDVWNAFRRQQGAFRMNHTTVTPHTSTAVPRTPTPTTFSPATSRPAPTTPPMVNVTGTWVAVVCNGLNELKVYHVAKDVATRWPTGGMSLPNDDNYFAPVFTPSGDFYIHGDTSIYRYRLATGKEHWFHQSGTSIVTMVANDDVVAVLRRDGMVTVVDSETGVNKCSYSTATAVVATPNFVAFQLTGGSALQFVDRNCATSSQNFGETNGNISAFGYTVCGGWQGTWTCANTENWQVNQWQISPSIEPIAGSSDAKDCAYVDHNGHAKLSDGLSSSQSAVMVPVAPSFGSPARGTVYFTVVLSSSQYSLLSIDRSGTLSASFPTPSSSPVGITAVYCVSEKATYAFVMQANGDLTHFRG